MSSKHLSTGSECPPLSSDGKLRIYSMRFCPYAQRALLAASAVGVPYDVVNCNLKQKPEWLFTKNPEGKVPVLELPNESPDGKILYESLIIADYLADKYPNRKLKASDPFQKALDRILIERFNAVVRLYYKLVYNTNCDSSKTDAEEEIKMAVKQLETELSFWDKEISGRNTKFFHSDTEPGMLDYMIWPWVERLPILSLFLPNYLNWEDIKKNNTSLAKWEENMLKDETVQSIYLSPNIHYAYSQSSKEGKPNYDLLENSSMINSNL